MSEPLFAAATNAPGMLVTLDGPNGSGKTVLTAAVAAELAARGLPLHSTCQPSSGRLGQYARAAEPELRGRALACLVAADRHQQVEGEIAGHLAAGKIVLCDRYVESSLVLQRIDGVETEFIVAINAGIPRPDLRIGLMARPGRIAERLAGRPRDPARRLERSAGPERELALYEEADRLLAERYGLAARRYDTSDTEATALATEVVALIERKRIDADRR